MVIIIVSLAGLAINQYVELVQQFLLFLFFGSLIFYFSAQPKRIFDATKVTYTSSRQILTLDRTANVFL